MQYLLPKELRQHKSAHHGPEAHYMHFK